METDTSTPMAEFLKPLSIDVVVLFFLLLLFHRCFHIIIMSGTVHVVSSDIYQYSAEVTDRTSIWNIALDLYFNHTMDKVWIFIFSQCSN
jgi:heme/copper-type cytochrome/quinol oxidase subunit 3